MHNANKLFEDIYRKVRSDRANPNYDGRLIDAALAKAFLPVDIGTGFFHICICYVVDGQARQAIRHQYYVEKLSAKMIVAGWREYIAPDAPILKEWYRNNW